MNKYKNRPGVVLAEICGEYLLVSTKEARETCPYVIQINETSSFLWKSLGEWMDLHGLMKCVTDEYEVDNPDQAMKAVESFVSQMEEMGYLQKASD